MLAYSKMLIIGLVFLSCTSSDEFENSAQMVRKYYANGSLKAEYEVNDKGERDGKFKSYYKNGQLRKITSFVNDSTQVNECLIFYQDGTLKEYSFFNVLGKKKYVRTYRPNGSLLEESGDFLCYILVDTRVSLGDSSLIDIYVASPPGCVYKIFGLEGDRKYLVGNERSHEQKYRTYLTKKETKVGEFVFPFEVVFMDTLNDKEFTTKDRVSFEVIDKQK